MKTFKNVGKILALIAAALATGCGQPPKTPKTPEPDASNRNMKALSLMAAGDSDWRCPSSENVTLKGNVGVKGFDYSGAGNFSVCSSRNDNEAKFKISGSTTSKSICIYPLYESASHSLQVREGYQCFDVGSKAIEVTFKAKDVNYLIIADSNYTDAMDACLSGPTACPAHSEGLVK